jgi:excisionase family DNA binding protein
LESADVVRAPIAARRSHNRQIRKKMSYVVQSRLQPLDTLYSFRETCEILHVSKSKLYYLLRDGEISGLKNGGSTQFRRSELERFQKSLKPFREKAA